MAHWLHSPTFPSLHLRDSSSSSSNTSVALPTAQLILQLSRCFTCVTAQSQTILSLLLRHRFFTYVTWRAAHGVRELLLLKKIFGPKRKKMENKLQFFNKTGQRGIPLKSLGTPGQHVEKRYCPGQNGTSGHFTLCDMCVSFGLTLLYTPTIINYLPLQFSIQ